MADSWAAARDGVHDDSRVKGMPVTVPETFAHATITREGDAGRQWINELPAIVDELLALWACRPDGDVIHGGVALIVPVENQQAEPFVLKVSFTHPGNVHEPLALTAWNGNGSVRLYESNEDRYAMLLERAGSTSLASVNDTDEAMRVGGRLSLRLAIPAPPECPPLQAHLADWRADLERGMSEFPRLFGEASVRAAIETIDAATPSNSDVLVHGDLHATNILRSERDDWLAIDPKGYAGDPAFDAGMVVKWVAVRMLAGAPAESFSDAALRRALDLYSDCAQLDRDRARDWARVHALQAAYWGRRHGFRRARQGQARDHMLEVVDDLATRLAVLGGSCPRR